MPASRRSRPAPTSASASVYRRFASKDALLDELLRVAIKDLVTVAERALARPDGHGLERLLRAIGRLLADHAGYAHLLLDRQPDPASADRLRDALAELTAQAVQAGTIGSGATLSDVITLISAMCGLAHRSHARTAEVWARFLDIHLAGLRETAAQARG